MQTFDVFTAAIPPRYEDVKTYFLQKGINEAEATDFFLFYEKKRWTNRNGRFYKSWKKIALTWIASCLHSSPHLFNRHIH